MTSTTTSAEKDAVSATDQGLSEYVETTSTPSTPKTTASGIVLVPQPTDDPKDPLNWPLWKKNLNLAVLVLSSFAGNLGNVANAGGLMPQAVLYEKTLVDISYSIAASVAGLAVGPMLWTPLARKFGRSLLIWWTMIGLLATSIWGASCDGSGDYISFVLSRLFAGIFGSTSNTIGASLILEIYFLHQRGKAFTVYSVIFLIGTIAGPTFSGFIVTYVSWTWEYWYNVIFEAFMVIVIPLCLSETGYTRPNGPVYPIPPKSWLQNRTATYITGSIMPRRGWGEVLRAAGAEFTIMVSPISLLVGGYFLVMFAWPVAVNTLLGVFLQTPVELGGYGFTPEENSYFLFTSWIAVAASQVYGHLAVDSLSIYLCKRFGSSIWKPEYRLHCLWFPGLILMPVGLGLFGASLHNHYHPAVLALGAFCLVTGAIIAVPVLDTYVVECFTTNAAEANAVMNTWRLVLGLAIPFFIDPWIAAVGVQWVFGSMAFFSILVFLLIVVVMVKGHTLRSATLGHLAADEEGTTLEVKSEDSGKA